jgi:FdhE protein
MSEQQFGELSMGNVAADEFARLPRLPALFERRTARMAQLSQGHPAAGFPRLMEKIFATQALACAKTAPVALPSPEAMAQATEHGMPLLSAESRPPTATYRDTLRFLAANIARDGLPPQTADVLNTIASANDVHLNHLAELYLTRTVTPQWRGEMLFVAAALQVEFARLAAGFDARTLKPLGATGLCPVCGSPPVAGVVVADDAYGRRFLTCGLCSTAWHHARISCIVCGEEGKVAYHGIGGDDGLAKAETCDNCKNYSKLFYQTKEMAVEALCDDLATLSLDLMVSNAGWKRHAPNPLVLML